jgi:hypothetical protein
MRLDCSPTTCISKPLVRITYRKAFQWSMKHQFRPVHLLPILEKSQFCRPPLFIPAFKQADIYRNAQNPLNIVIHTADSDLSTTR